MEEKGQNFLDMVIAMSDLATLKVIDGKSDQLTVTYTTSAVLEAQKVWMESQLGEWYQDLEKKFNVKLDKYTFKGVIDRIDVVGPLPVACSKSSAATSNKHQATSKQVEIIDYKTGQLPKNSKLSPDDKEQLLIYHLAVREVLHLKPVT